MPENERNEGKNRRKGLINILRNICKLSECLTDGENNVRGTKRVGILKWRRYRCLKNETWLVHDLRETEKETAESRNQIRTEF